MQTARIIFASSNTRTFGRGCTADPLTSARLQTGVPQDAPEIIHETTEICMRHADRVDRSAQRSGTSGRWRRRIDRRHPDEAIAALRDQLTITYQSRCIAGRLAVTFDVTVTGKPP